MDLFGFEAPARAPVQKARPVQEAPPPVRPAPPPVAAVVAAPAVLAVDTPPMGQDLPPWRQPRRPLAEIAIRGCQDIEDVTDGATLSLAHAFQGWDLNPPGKVYSGLTHHQAVQWAVASLEADGWLRTPGQPGPQRRFVLEVHPPVNCGLEVYQLLVQMQAALAGGQVVAANPDHAAALRRWQQNAERTLFNHRAAALTRKEPHA